MKQNKVSSKRIVLIVACVILAVLLVALVSAVIYMESMLNLINKRDPAVHESTLSSSQIDDLLNQTDAIDPDYTGPYLDGDDVTWGPDIDDSLEKGENIVNILLIGQDRRKGEGRSRSDAMILCTINRSAKTLTISSFMRDMYVQIPGYRDNRINVSYAIGGMPLLDSCIQKNFGVQIDGNFEVDFSGFQKIIDKVGGVEIELTTAEANFLNKNGNWDVENNAGQWNLKAGVNNLNGSQALAYSRIRYVGNGDFGRTNRQRVVLNSLMNKAKNMSVIELNGLLKEILPMLTTDLSDSQILEYASYILPMLSDLTVTTQQIPADGAYRMTMIDGMSVLLPDLEKNREILADIMKE